MNSIILCCAELAVLAQRCVPTCQSLIRSPHWPAQVGFGAGGAGDRCENVAGGRSGGRDWAIFRQRRVERGRIGPRREVWVSSTVS